MQKSGRNFQPGLMRYLLTQHAPSQLAASLVQRASGSRLQRHENRRMPSSRIPTLLRRSKIAKIARECPGHRAWVRKHKCSVRACAQKQIECAHVRLGTNGGMGIKPSDAWCISLCQMHHAEQHAIGEKSFEERYELDLKALAIEFARRSPHWHEVGAIF